MKNLDNLYGNELIDGFAQIVREWYDKLEEHQIIPSGFIDQTKSFKPPFKIPRELQLYYDLITQGYRLDVQIYQEHFEEPRIVSGHLESTGEEVEIIQFGNNGGHLGAYEIDIESYHIVQKDHNRGVWITQKYNLVDFLVTAGLRTLCQTSPSLIGHNTLATSIAESLIENSDLGKHQGKHPPKIQKANNQKDCKIERLLVEGSHPIWSSHNSGAYEIRWHQEGFMICRSSFFDLGFCDFTQMKEWQKKTSWSISEQKLVSRSDQEIISKNIYPDKRVFEALKQKDTTFFANEGIPFPKNTELSRFYDIKAFYITNTRENIDRFKSYIENAEVNLAHTPQQPTTSESDGLSKKMLETDSQEGEKVCIEIYITSELNLEKSITISDDDQMIEFLNHPEVLNKVPYKEDIILQSESYLKINGRRVNFDKGDPRVVYAKLWLYFDHKGNVHCQYDGTAKMIAENYFGQGMLRDPSNTSDETIELTPILGYSKFNIYARNMVPVEMLIPYALELMKSGELDVSSDDAWEDLHFPK